MKITNLKDKLISCALILIIVLIMYVFHIPCIIKTVLQFPCPGCGMTRAYLSLLSADFQKAFQYNPMFWSAPILFLLYLFDGRIFRKNWLNYTVTYTILAGFLALWIYRFALHLSGTI